MNILEEKKEGYKEVCFSMKPQSYHYPKKVPFYEFLIHAKSLTKNPIPFHRNYFNLYGDSFSVALSKKNKIFLTRNPEIAKHVLQSNHKKYMKSEIQTKFLSKYVGFGLLTSNGELWLKQRRLIQPAFHKKKLASLLKIMEQSIKQELKKIPNGTSVDVYQLMNELAFNVVAESLFSFTSDKNTLNRLQHIIAELQRFIVKELRQPHMRWWMHLSGAIDKHLVLAKESRAIILDIILERKASKAHYDDLLDMLLNATYQDGSSISDEQLIDEILILFVAGHETTANALTFAVHLLGKNPEHVYRIIQEASALANGYTLTSLASLTYTRAVVDETLRLYPPAWITDRVAITDDQVAGFSIEKGTIVGISFYELHRSEKHWEAPTEFNPTRFLGEQAKTHKAYYYPFGAGPRMCIGNNFAIFEMIMTLAELYKHYRVTPEKTQLKVNPLITLKPEGVKAIFHKINEC